MSIPSPVTKTSLELSRPLRSAKKSPHGAAERSRSPKHTSPKRSVDIVVTVPSNASTTMNPPQADLKRQYKNLLAEIEETKPKLRQLEVLQSEVKSYFLLPFTCHYQLNDSL